MTRSSKYRLWRTCSNLLNEPTQKGSQANGARLTSLQHQVNLPSAGGYFPASQTRPSTVPPLSTMNTSTANTW